MKKRLTALMLAVVLTLGSLAFGNFGAVDATADSACAHTCADWALLGAPTEQANGLRAGICSLCGGEVYDEVVYASGDIDGDGALTNADVALAIRALSGYEVEGALRFDTNYDGKLTNREAIFFIQRLAWNIPEDGEAVVFVRDGGTGDGSSAKEPLGNIADAYTALGSAGGTIVVCGSYNFSSTVANYQYVAPAHTGKITVTQKYNGVDYRDGAANSIYVSSGSRWALGGETVFENVSFKNAGGKYILIVAQCNPVTFGEGIAAYDFTFKDLASSVAVLGGYQNGFAAHSSGTSKTYLDSNITINSGKYIIVGMSRQIGASAATFTGDINITVNGGEIAKMYAGCANSGSHTGKINVTINGGKILTKIFTNRSEANYTTGNATVVISGGDFSACTGIVGAADTKNVLDLREYPNPDEIRAIATDFATILDGTEPEKPTVTVTLPARPVAPANKIYTAHDQNSTLGITASTSGGQSATNPYKTSTVAYWDALWKKDFARDGGTLVVVGKAYFGKTATIPATTNPLMFTAVDGDTSYISMKNGELDYMTASGGHGTQYGMFILATDMDMIFEGDVIFDNIVILNRMSTSDATKGTPVANIVVNGKLVITDTVQFAEMTGKKQYNLVVNEGAYAFLDAMGFEAYVGEGTIVLSDALTADFDEADFVGFEGIVTDKNGTVLYGEVPEPKPEVIVPDSYEQQFDATKSGIYNYCPSIMQIDESTAYIYYCTNKTSNNVTDYIGCRKATRNADGSWTWGSETLVLSPSSSTIFNKPWDSRHACDPSVIKGNFTYNGEQYSYLMAYLGCKSNDSQDNEIGLAVSKTPDGQFTRVGSAPFVGFEYLGSSDIWEWGVGQPSIINIDKESRVMLFYTRGDRDGTRTIVEEWNLADLNNPVRISSEKLSAKGLKTLTGTQDIMNNADFAYDPVTNRYYAASDCHPNPSDTPDYIASHFRVTYFDYTGSFTSFTWKSISTIGPDQTGFARNHNVGILRDAYGHITEDYLSVFYTVSITGDSSLWSYRIYDYFVAKPD